MCVVIIFKAVVVPCDSLRPCWCEASCKCSFRDGNSTDSKTFNTGHSREIGRYDSPFVASLSEALILVSVLDY